jgi:hypothetical protein
MKIRKTIQEMVRLLVGFVIVAAITIAIISTLREPATSITTTSASPNTTTPSRAATAPPQEPTTAVPYPVPPEYLPPNTECSSSSRNSYGCGYLLYTTSYLSSHPSSKFAHISSSGHLPSHWY